MALEDRYDKVGTVKSVSLAINDAGGRRDVEADLLTGWDFYDWPPSPRQRQYIRQETGQEVTTDIRMLTGGYSALITEAKLRSGGLIVVNEADSTERFKVLAVWPQRGSGAEPHHLSLVAVRQKRTAAEGS